MKKRYKIDEPKLTDYIKIIELVIKKYNGKELPKKIVIKDVEFYLHKDDKNYYDIINRPLSHFIDIFSNLDEEVEIRQYAEQEEPKEEPIKEIEVEEGIDEELRFNYHVAGEGYFKGSKELYTGRKIDKIIITKVNQLVKEVNKMKGC